MMCRHENAIIEKETETTILVQCKDCDLGWYGLKEPWYSYRGKLHKPPKWVLSLIGRLREEQI